MRKMRPIKGPYARKGDAGRRGGVFAEKPQGER
jgi:hypothetical protein